MRTLTETGLIALALVLFAGPANAARLQFKAKLTGASERPPVVTDMEGRFELEFNREGTEARISLRLENGLVPTQAHLHCTYESGDDPIAATIFGPVTGKSDTLGGRVEQYRQGPRHSYSHRYDGILTDEDISAQSLCDQIHNLHDLRNAIENGYIYANVASATYPAGEVRGQVSYFGNDTDGDGIPDRRDSDIDGDGIANAEDFTPYGAFLRSSPPRVVRFFYDPRPEHGGKVICNGDEKAPDVPASCELGGQGLTISRTGWSGNEAFLAFDGVITGACEESVSEDPNTADAYQLTPGCNAKPKAAGPRKDATGEQLVDEWFTDLPWHQKLSTLDSNLIDIPFVMPFEALPKKACPSAVTPTEKARCMLQYGIVDVMAMHRTDTLYKTGEAPAGQHCSGTDCVEVRIEVQRVHTLPTTDPADPMPPYDPHFFEADPVRNNPYSGEPPVPSLGFAITEATMFAPWRPWYMGHFCGKERVNYIDAVCYDDYFTTQLAAAADTRAANPVDKEGWLDASTVYKSYPAVFDPQAELPDAPHGKFCRPGEYSCSMYLGKVEWLTNATKPLVVGCAKDDRNTSDTLSTCQDEVDRRTAELDRQFNDALLEFADVGRYPWPEIDRFELGDAIEMTPFIGYYDLVRYSQSGGGSIPSSLFKAPQYVLPRPCSKADFVAARKNNSEAIARLKDCVLDFEIHTSGYHEIWKELYGGDVRNIDAKQISNVLPGVSNNQYGRTMFMYAGVPEQKIPVSFRFLEHENTESMSVHDKVYGSSLYTQYLPLVNPADTTSKDRPYKDNFWHAFFMSNHMNQTPDHFVRGIRGRTLWHNEYRSNLMYLSDTQHKDVGTPFEGILGPVDFPAGFQVADHQSPFHGNTCDSCHIRNGSGIPLMPNGKLPQTQQGHIERHLNDDFHVNGRDYTYTNEELPSMKMVLFDLNDRSESRALCDADDHTTPKSDADDRSRDRYYRNKIMNFFGNSFPVNQEGRSPTYQMEYLDITPDSKFEVVDNTLRFRPDTGVTYVPQRVHIWGVDSGGRCETSADIKPEPSDLDGDCRSKDCWPRNCADVAGGAMADAISRGEVGFLHLLGRRLGNTPLIEMIPDRTIKDAARSQRDDEGFKYSGCYVLTAGTRIGTSGQKNYRSCPKWLRNFSDSNACYIGRWGWMGDRASLEDQIANAAVVEMNITSKGAYESIQSGERDQEQMVRYNEVLCGPADAKCEGGAANSDITEQEIEDMATYQRWIGIPQRSERQVSSEIVQRGEEVFNDLGCSSCHIIRKISFVQNDNMLPDEEREQLKKLQVSGEQRPDYPFVSYLGTDLLLHDMGYLSQVARSPGDGGIRDGSSGTVKREFRAYVQRIRTPALKGLRFNRFVTDSNHNTKRPIGTAPQEDVVPGCDFLLHDGRACDAIEAAFLHDGPAVKRLQMIDKLSHRDPEDIDALRAFLYSL